MEDLMDKIIGFGAIVLVVAVFVLAIYFNRQSKKELRTWAKRHGWDNPEHADDLQSAWRATQETGGAPTRIVRKQFPEGEVFAFENTYSSSPGSIINKHVVGVDLGTDVPTMVLQDPRRAGFSKSEVPVEIDDPSFSRRWSVHTLAEDDVAAVRRFLAAAPDFRQRLTGDDPLLTGTVIALADQHLMLGIGGDRDLAQIQPATALARELASALQIDPPATGAR